MSGSDELLRLFDAERAEAPPSTAQAKGWLDLASSLDAGVKALPVAHGPLKLGLSVVSQWLVGAGVTALVIGGTTLALSRPAPPEPVTAVAPRAVASSQAAAVASAPVHAMPVQTPEKEETSVAARKPTPAISASAETSTFADELRLIRLAKQELDAGRPHLAQVWLDEHERLYPSGVFSGERAALKVLLACQRSPAAGREAARQFSTANPHSPLLDRISRACGLSPQAVPPTASSKFPDLEVDK